MESAVNILLSLLGIVLTILGFDYFKKKKYPGKLVYIEERATGLFASLVANFPQISILYENKSINQQIILLRGFIINEGSTDINDSMVEERLSLNLPEGVRLLNVKVVDLSRGSKATLEARENIVFFDLGLFRKNEFVRFEALIDVPLSRASNLVSIRTVLGEMKFVHRIANTEVVQEKFTSLELPDIRARYKRWSFLPVFLSMIALPIMMIIAVNKAAKQNEIFLYHLKSDSATITVQARPNLGKNSVDLYSDKKKVGTLNVNDFNSRLQKVEVVNKYIGKGFINFVYRNFGWVILILCGTFYCFMLNLVLGPLIDYQRIKKRRKTLNLENK